MRFIAEVELEVDDQDVDLMEKVPNFIIDRFAGTAVRVKRVTVTKQEES